jgi:5'-nucleotidase
VEPDGYSITRLGRHSYGYDVVENVDPRGRKYYWIGGNDYAHEDIPGSDCNAVHREKRVSVTPLQMEMTDHGRMADLAGWALEGFRRVESGG